MHHADTTPDATPDAILGLGTALPGHVVEQAQAARSVAAALPAGKVPAELVARVFRLTGVASRHSCVSDFGDRGPGPLLARPPRGTAYRMELYARHAPPLAEAAARRALSDSGHEPASIDHVVIVSCTGFVAPGVDVMLAERLGLRADVERTTIGFMGCHGAFNGLRVARAVAAGDKTVLLVCVELCSLHVQDDDTRDGLVSAGLFGDGAAAVVVGRETEDHPALVRLGQSASALVPDGGAHMAWEVGDHGFRMRLSSYVPALLGADLAAFVEPLRVGRDVASWCVHPGGPAILKRVETVLGLPRTALASSRAVLRTVGNVSSATVLFVLAREVERLDVGEQGVLLGFGPGLTLEGAAFERGPARVAELAHDACRTPAGA